MKTAAWKSHDLILGSGFTYRFFFQLSCTTAPLWHSVPQNLCVQINFGGAIIIERKWHTRSLMSNMDPMLDPANRNDLLEFAPCRMACGWRKQACGWRSKKKQRIAARWTCVHFFFGALYWRILSAERELQWPIDNVPICERSSSWSWWSLQPWRPKVVGNPIQSTSPNVRALRVVEDGRWKIGAEWPSQHTNCKALRQRRLF